MVKEKAEKKKKAEEYKLWMEERKAKLAAEANRPKSAAKVRPPHSEKIDLSKLEAKMEERRLRWIQECTPWRYGTANLILCWRSEYIK